MSIDNSWGAMSPRVPELLLSGGMANDPALLEQLVRTAPIGFAIIDAQGRYSFVNEYLAALNNRPAHEHLGRTPAEVLPPAPARLIGEWCRQAMSTGEPITNLELGAETPVRPGKQRHWVGHVYPLRAEGRIASVGVIVEEDTDRRDAEEAVRASEARFRKLYESNVVGVLYGDLAGKIYDANPALARMLGYTREELIHLGWRAITPPDEQSEADLASTRLRLHELPSISVEREYLCQDGTRLPVIVVTSLIDGVGERTLAFVIDNSDRKRAQRVLEESEQRLRFLANLVPQLIWTADAQGVIDYQNDRFREATRLTVDDFRGDSWRSAVHPDDADHVLAEWSRSISTGAPFFVEARLRDPVRHEWRWYLIRAEPFHNDHGHRIKWFGSCTDVDELRRTRAALDEALGREKVARAVAQSSEAQLRLFIDSLPALAWTARPDGWIDFYNRSWYEYTGLTPEQVEGWGWQAVHDPAELPRVLERWRHSLATGEPFEEQFPLRRADGVYRWHLTRGTPIRDSDGRIIRWVGTNTDIDDERKLQAERARLLGVERQAREEAERAVRFSELFVGIISHDLRNPLAAILTGAQWLLRSSTNEQQVRASSRIVGSAERMGRMIEQLLDFTRIRLGGGLTLQRKASNLAALCHQVLAEAESAHPECSIVSESVGDATGEWDSDRLLQVFSNLVGNAIRHGAANCPISLVVDGRSAESVSVRIHNQGAIPPELLPTIFEPFRGSGTGRHSQLRGLGLGLYITQQIVTAHGGRVEVESSAEAGTTFTVRLPRR